MTKPLAIMLINKISSDGNVAISFMRNVGRDEFCTLSQSSVSIAVHKICGIISSKLGPKYVKFPSTIESAAEIKNGILTKCGVPGIIGLVDGLHVALTHLPKDIEYSYVNRKNFKSINVQT